MNALRGPGRGPEAYMYEMIRFRFHTGFFVNFIAWQPPSDFRQLISQMDKTLRSARSFFGGNARARLPTKGWLHLMGTYDQNINSCT